MENRKVNKTHTQESHGALITGHVNEHNEIHNEDRLLTTHVKVFATLEMTKREKSKTKIYGTKAIKNKKIESFRTW